jgi:penicillin amidase
VREEIRVKGRARPEVETVHITRHGPLLNDVVKALGVFLALRWTALEPDQTVASVLRLDRAQTWEEFRDALRLWTVPAQNFVYADRTGTIGYQLPGRIPIRAKGNGLVPVPGWTGEYEWVGEIPFDLLPSVRNPHRGFLVTANNRITPDGYPFFISADWDPGFRASRIDAVLRDTPRITPDVMAALQMDVTSLPGQVTVRALRDVHVTTEPAAALLKTLQAWDGVLRPDSRAAAIYEAFRLAVLPLLFKDALGAELFQRYRGHSDAWQVALLHLLQDPVSPWWGSQGRDAVITAALERAHQMLEQRLGLDPAQWLWGRLHRTRFVHPLGGVPALGWIFNAQAPPLGGDAFTVNTAGFDPDTFEQVMVASYRQIIDLADWDRAISIHTTGQSGLPFHPHYRDFMPLWAAGRYHPMLFSRGRIEQAISGTLTLTP